MKYKILGFVMGLCTLLAAGLVQAAQKPDSLKIALVTFTTGSGGTVGGPSVNAAKLTIDQINKNGGIDGVPIKARYIDESGGTSKNIAEFRSLANKVDLVLGYVSSSNCLAVAPVAEKLKVPTIFTDCTTNSLFADHDYKWVFRTQTPASVNAVSMAMYILKSHPDLQSIGGINQDYAFGHDQWKYFTEAMKALKPGIKVESSQFPELFSGHYSSVISRILVGRPDLVYSSLWGGDLMALIQQGKAQGMFDQSQVALSLGTQAGVDGLKALPAGVIVGSESSYLMHPGDIENPKVAKFVKAYKDRFGKYPVSTYPFTVRRGLMAIVDGYKKAIANNDNKWSSSEQFVEALPGLEVDTIDGTMKIRKDHQSTYHETVGVSVRSSDYPFAVFNKIIKFPASLVMPPADYSGGIDKWIKLLSPDTLDKVSKPKTYGDNS
jgi:branched-chain amino acid transport system substrate-binding protein